jgi:hypothetical protein
MVDGDPGSMVFYRFGYSVGILLKLKVSYPNSPNLVVKNLEVGN